VPCSLALLNHACRDDATARARAISLWTAAGSIGLAAGPIIGGALVSAFGIWLLRDIDAATPYSVMLPGLILLPFGIGFAVPVMTSALLATVPRVRAGVASGVLNSVRQAGGAIGVALFGGMMAAGSSGIADAFIAGTLVLGTAAAIAVCFIGAAPLTMLAGVARNAADNR
jgi:DHA2 family methylenomycin A resistance protein-like MFS transporter